MSESLINRLIDMHKQIFLYGNWLLELRYQVLQQKEENIRLRSERDTAKKELEELKAKLPRTADGVALVPYKDFAWQASGLWVRKASFWRLFDDGWYISPDTAYSFMPLTSCYSTEKAASDVVGGAK